MHLTRPLLPAAACALAVLALGSGTSAAHDGGRVKHVMLLSVDGLHQSDLDWYLSHHPSSALAGLVARGEQFSDARTPVPSDSFPGMVGQVTGGDPGTTGVWYDDTFNP